MVNSNYKIKVIIPFINEKYVFNNNLYESWLNSNKELTDFHILFFNKNYLIESQIHKLHEYNITHSFLDGNIFFQSLTKIIKESDSKFIAIANPHLLFLPDWDSELIKLFENKNKAAALFGKIVDSNNLILEAGFSYKKDEEFYNYGFMEKDDSPKFNFVTSLDFGSQYFLFLEKDIFLKQSKSFNYSNYDLQNLLWQFSKVLKENNYELWYQPASKFVYNNFEINNDYEDCPINVNNNENSYNNNFNVLALISYSNHNHNNIENIVNNLKNTELRIDFELINLDKENIDLFESNIKQRINIFEKNYDYIIIIKDSISLSKNFLKNFLELQNNYKFDLAQPARMPGSFISNPILEKANGIKARKTDFITTSPLLSISSNYFDILITKCSNKLFSYNELCLFADEFEIENLSLGIIDSLPVYYLGHSILKDISSLTKEQISLNEFITNNFIVKEVYV